MFYKKKPATVEAVKFLGFDEFNVPVFNECPNWLLNALRERKLTQTEGLPAVLIVHTLEGRIHASEGDYLVKVLGDLYPYKPYIFDQIYEEVAEYVSQR